MSFAARALVLCAVKALLGRTSVGDAVFDSRLVPLDGLEPGDEAAMIVVSADGGTIDIVGRDVFNAAHRVTLTFDLFIGRAKEIQAGNETVANVEIPETDEGFEMFLAPLRYQMLRVLFAPVSEGSSNWADLFRRMILKAADNSSEWDRGATVRKGRRLALHRLVLRLETLSEPIPGAPVDGDWADLIAAMEADEDLEQHGLLWRTLIETPALADWQRAQALNGLADDEAEKLGLRPLADPDALLTAAALGENQARTAGSLPEVVGNEEVPSEPALYVPPSQV